MLLLGGTVRLSRPRPVSGVNYIAPTRLANGKASLDPLRSVQFSSVQFSSVQFSSVQSSVQFFYFIRLTTPADIYIMLDLNSSFALSNLGGVH